MRSLALTSLALVLCTAASAQTAVLRHLGPADGVGAVQSLSLDPEGDVWLATLRGLVRHDGVRFVRERPGATRAVAVGDDGTLWAWTEDELRVRAAGTRQLVPVPLPEALRTTFATRWRMYLPMRPLADGGLLVLDPPSGLWRLHPDQNRWTLLVPSRPGEPVADAVEIRPGEIAVLTNQRLGLVQIGGPRVSLAWILQIAEGHHVRWHPEGLWIATNKGLYLRHHDGRVQTVLSERYRCWFTDPDVTPDGTLALSIEQPGEKAVYVVSSNGEVQHKLRVGQELSNLPGAVRFDADGGLWLAGSQGLSYAEDLDELRLYPLSAPSVMGISVAPTDGALWVGTYGGGLFRFNGVTFDPLIVDPELDGATPPRFDADGAARGVAFGGRPFRRQGYRWLGTQGGPASSLHMPVATLPDGRVLTNRLDPDGAADFRSSVTLGEQEISRGEVTAIASSRDRTWLAINHQLDVLDGNGLGRANPGLSPSLRRVLAMFEGLGVYALASDAWGRVWAATERGLVVLIESEPSVWNAHRLGPEEGLDLDSVSRLAVDGDDLWVAASTGLRRYALHEEAPWLRERPVGRIASALPVEGVSHVAVDGEGTVWVVPNGLATLYRLRPTEDILASPELRVSEWRINDRAAAFAPARWRADTTRIALAFAPRSMRRVEEIHVEYRIPAIDTSWVALRGEPTVRFDRLAPGRYRVEARAIRAGQPPGPVLAVPFVMTPPFWRAPWFLSLLALGLAGALGGTLVRRERLQRQRAATLEVTVEARTAELRAATAETEAHARQLEALGAAKGRFFQNVSHELRTPLTLLLGPLRDALHTDDGQARLVRQLPLMNRAGERLRGLVDELLDLARLETGTLRLHAQPVDLVALTQQTVEAMAAQAREEALTLAFHPDLPHLKAQVDPVRYEQVLTNLLGNAFKFTPSGGKVRVELAREDGTARLMVRDTGQGIPPDQLETVFERFHQVDGSPARTRPGVGIGLALVRELVELHGGAIQAESTPGFGSTFTVTLPLGQAEALPEPPAPVPEDARQLEGAHPFEAPRQLDETSKADPAPPDAASATVLVVEDHADLRDYLADLLHPAYRVLTASDGQEGLDTARRLAQDGTPPDLILSDVMMPGLDGVALCRVLKSDPQLGHVPVVLLTARADETSRLEGLSVGADDYLAKPFSSDELMARMENLIEMRRYLRARLATARPGTGNPSATPETQGDEDRQLEDHPLDREAWLDAVREAARDRLSDSAFGTDWLAEQMGLSTRQFRRRLKAAIGLTPGAFLRALRLEHAATLLDVGEGSIAEVASAVGYADADSFSRAFRRGYGMAPSEWSDRPDLAPSDRDARPR